ncbi:hypothetical protein SBF1_3320005 [Candidatus Desulfosporosinus infrequens]|uniref:Uncharacterized protein n=1 Tax=Candidatus Desulfosporosinus infrequens TaxID=2043169 RepID=A0A2U3L0N2_9FIRM|nr:hypothetical protein SBF1_3320005 [Candidatus Desulfosporosinus infrequens]
MLGQILIVHVLFSLLLGAPIGTMLQRLEVVEEIRTHWILRQ